MLALKDVKGIGPALRNGHIARSFIWEMDVERIVPAQLLAFRERMSAMGLTETADIEIRNVLIHVGEAYADSSIKAPLLSYIEPPTYDFSMMTLRRGLERLERPYRTAVMFGIETGLPAERVVGLTRQEARAMSLSPYATMILRRQPLHMRLKYVFWTLHDDKPIPLFGLAREVFDVFGMEWGELRRACFEIVPIDEDVLALDLGKSLQALLLNAR